jgi:hypothetical protein
VATNRFQLYNDVADRLLIRTDEQVLSSIISYVLSTVINNAKDSNIRISAKVYSNIIVLHVKDQSSFNNKAVVLVYKSCNPWQKKSAVIWISPVTGLKKLRSLSVFQIWKK